MNLVFIDWFIICGFFLVSLSIGLYYRNRASSSIEDFFLGGRNLPWYIAGISMVATTFAADTPLAVTELVGKYGVSGNWLWWSFLFGGMLTTFFFARLWRRSGVLTEVEFIEIRYSGTSAAILRGFKSIYLGLFMNILIIGWVNLALSALLVVFFGIPESEVLKYVAAVMFIAAIYSSLSGLWGVAVTDVIQFFVAMIGTIILAFLVVNSEEIGGIDGLKYQLLNKSPSSLDFFPSIGSSNSLTGTLTLSIGAFLAYTTVQWWASWYPGAEPGGGGYVAQRIMSCKDEKSSIYATLFFQIAHYCIRPWPWILVALSCIILYPDLSDDDLRLGYVMAMKDFLPVGFKGLLLVAFLAAYMSTISTQLNWGAGYLVNDFYKRFINKNASEKNLVFISRLFTMILMFLSLFATNFMTSISGVWIFIIECGAGLGLLLILRWYWWRINAWSEITATIAPFIGYAFSRYYLSWEFPNTFFLTVGFTTFLWLLVTFLTKPVNNDKLESFYKKVRPDGVWTPFNKVFRLSDISNLIICWLSAVCLTYGSLFLFGKLIFKEWQHMLYSLLIVVISFVVLRKYMRKINILD